MLRSKVFRLNLALLLGVVSACAGAVDESSPRVEATKAPLWSNGDFESDVIGATPPTGWSVLTYLNSSGVTGSSSTPPSSFAALNLSVNAGKMETYAVGGAVATQVDPDLGAGQPFRFPKYGSRAARVNYKSATDSGKDKNANALRQSMTIGLSDIDPSDGKVHVRFAVAPVLEVPAHGYTQQPYYFIELLNMTRGTTLYRDFNVAGQSGVPWRTTISALTGNTTQWLDWQLIDLAPGATAVSVGDQVQLTVLGAGCAYGGHFGRVYVDGVGPSVPGLFAWATGPASAASSSNIAYTVYYSNGGASTAIGAHVDMAIPPQTTFQSVAGISGCSVPTVGATGTISCPLGALAPASSGSFTVNVAVASTATGNIVNGNYSIAAVNASSLLGAKVTTAVLSSTTRFSDARVTQTANVTSTSWGGSVTYTIKIKNLGTSSLSSSQLSVSDVFPAQLTGVTWTCARTAGSSSSTACNGSSGSGNISTRPKIGSNGEVTYTVTANVVAGSGLGSVVNTPTATVSGRVDPNLSNNTAPLTLAIGIARTLNLTKAGSTSSGSVVGVPAALSCGTSCASTTSTYASGSSVLLSATAAPGATFTGWSGGTCSGTGATCEFTISADTSVTATFAAAPAVGAAANVYAYTGDNQLARAASAFAAPLSVLVTDANGNAKSGASVTFSAPGSGASASLSSSTVTTNAAGIATVTATANGLAGTYSVSATVSGVGSVATFTLTNSGVPSRLTYISGGNSSDPNRAPIGTAFLAPLTILLTDAAGSPVPGATVTFAAPGSGASATLSSTTAVTDSSGFASVLATANATAGAFHVSASSSGITSDVSFSLQNIDATPASVFVMSGSGQHTPTGTAFEAPLVVGVADAIGNPLHNITVSFGVPGSGASALLSAASASTDALGVASVTATANGTPGTYLASATVAGVTTPASLALTNDGAELVDVYGGDQQSAQVGQAFGAHLVVVVTDSGTGLPVQGVVVSFSAPASGASAAVAASATTDVNGLASVSAAAGLVAGSYIVTASTARAGAVATFGLTNLAGSPSAVVAASGSGQSSTVGSEFASPLVATVRDSHGNAVEGATVVFSAPGSGASALVGSAASTTDAMGQASSRVTAGSVVGSYAVMASVAGAPQGASFSLTNLASIGCAHDMDCSSDQYCDTSRHECAQKLANGDAIPALAGHNPLLTGVCTEPVGASVCRSGVCGADNRCGYAIAEGSCDQTSASSVCRSGACSVSGVCMPTSGCAVAGDCSFANASADCVHGGCTLASCAAGYASCDGSSANGCEQHVASSDASNCGGCGVVCAGGEYCAAGSCASKKSGSALCSEDRECIADICASDGRCGVAAGGSCSGSQECRSGPCSASHVCLEVGRCLGDSDCSHGEFCDPVASVCSPKLGLGTAIPTLPGHNPPLEGACTAQVAAAVCASGVCDADGRCGYANAAGACDEGNAAVRCRSQACGSDGKCGYNNGAGTCAGLGPSPVCRSAVCGGDGRCGYRDNEGSCSSTDAPAVCRSGYCSVAGACRPTVGCLVAEDCGFENAAASCDEQRCALASCDAGYADCDGVPSNGCELQVAGGDVYNCGGCGVTCALGHAISECRSGACAVSSCTGGYADCDATTANGCERLVMGDDPLHCGACGHACGADEYCASGSCVAKLSNGAPCTSDNVCGSGVCDQGDLTCGSRNGSVCTSASSCRQGACSVSGLCMDTGSCLVDLDCDTDELCDTGAARCQAKLANGEAIPVIPGHSPALGGACSLEVGASVCLANVCDASDDRCGYGNGVGSCTSSSGAVVCRSGVCGSDGRCGYPDPEGPCTNSSAATLCRSGACSIASGVCLAAEHCLVDGDCTGAQFCDTALGLCAEKLANGVQIPLIAGHDPVLAGACTQQTGAVACASGACDQNDDKCGYLNGYGICVAGGADAACRSGVCGGDGKCGYRDGEGTCTSVDAGGLCRSGLCSGSSHVCVAANGCLIDADCLDTELCDTAAAACVPKLGQGVALPVNARHVPALTGDCTPEAARVACLSGVCDADGRCGYMNGSGACSTTDAGALCRSGACGLDGKCGYADGEGSCSSGNAGEVCRSGLCAAASRLCIGTGGCAVDDDCLETQYCDSERQQCVTKLATGMPLPVIAGHAPPLNGVCSPEAARLVCMAAVCDAADDRCGLQNGAGPCDASAAGLVCRSGVCGADRLCGYPDKEGDCTALDAGNVCRSGVCSRAGVCKPTNGCAAPADCSFANAEPDCIAGSCALGSCQVGFASCDGVDSNGCETTVHGDDLQNCGACGASCQLPFAASACQQGVCAVAQCEPGHADCDAQSSNGCETEVLGSDGTNCGACGVACSSASFCLAGICTGRRPQGQACASAGECIYGVCASDGRCGLLEGEPCDGPEGCREGNCSVAGVCVAATGCRSDADCSTSAFCDTTTLRCTERLPDGATIPIAQGHDPELSGVCTAAAAAAVCRAGVCSVSDNRCGLPNAEGPCMPDDASLVCRSHVCAEDGLCGYPDSAGHCDAANAAVVCRSAMCRAATQTCGERPACATDADCDSSSFCASGPGRCEPKRDNGVTAPSSSPVAGAAAPGGCVDGGGSACKSGVCDPSDGRCGYANGHGSCEAQSAQTVCRSGVCGSDLRCGYAASEGVCDVETGAVVCRSGRCAADVAVCAAEGCDIGSYASGQYCELTSGQCRALRDDGSVCREDTQCRSGRCDVQRHVCNSCVGQSCGHVKLSGGGCAVALGRAPTPPVAPFVLWLVLFSRRLRARRRSRSDESALTTVLLALASMWIAAPSVAAQPRESFALQRYEPSSAGDWSLRVDQPRYAKQLSFAAGLTLDYCHRPLVLVVETDGRQSESRAVIEHQLYGHLDLAVSLRERLVLTLSLPILLYEQGQAAVGIEPGSVAAGDPRFGALIRLFGATERAPVSLHLGAQLWIPAGGADKHVGDRGARFAPRAVVAGAHDWLRWSALAQLQFRREASIGALPTAAGNTVGSELQLGAAVAYASASHRFSAGPEAMLATVVTRGRSFERKFTSLELLIAGHYAPIPCWLVSAGVGMGALREPGSPDTRLLLRVTYNAIAASP